MARFSASRQAKAYRTQELERAVRFELTINGFAVQCVEHLGDARLEIADLRFQFVERRERFELSRRVWKTRMFPATSPPRVYFRFKVLGFRFEEEFDFSAI